MLDRTASLTRFAVVAGLLSMAMVSPAPDWEKAQTAHISVSGNGSHYFKMSPDPEHRGDRDRGFGYAYSVGSLDESTLLWSTEGWYSLPGNIWLSNDGRYLARLGSWPRGREPKDEDLGVAFYDRGVLIESYSTKQLVRDTSRLEHSTSHYQFLDEAERPTFADSPAVFPNVTLRLTTVDRVRYTFDVAKGKILEAAQLD